MAEAFIVEQPGPLRLQPGRLLLIPIVDEFGSVHGKKLLATEMGSEPHVSGTRFGNLAIEATLWDEKMVATSLRLGAGYFSFGGNVRPNTEILPFPATLIFASSGLGKYNVLQCSQR